MANVKVQERPNINPGVSAVTSKFEQSALRTFLSRISHQMHCTSSYVRGKA